MYEIKDFQKETVLTKIKKTAANYKEAVNMVRTSNYKVDREYFQNQADYYQDMLRGMVFAYNVLLMENLEVDELCKP